MTKKGSLTVFDYAPATVELPLNDPNVVTQTRVVLQNGQPVRGYIGYADGVAAADITISARPQGWYAISAEQSRWPVGLDGVFTLGHILPGLYDIYVTRQYSSGWISHVLIHGQPLPLRDGGPLVLALPDKSPVSVSGTLTFVGGPKPRNVELDARAPGLRESWGRVRPISQDDVPEAFAIEGLEPGKYRVTFSGAGIKRKVLEDVQAPGKDLQIELTCTGPDAQMKVESTVVDGQTGQPIRRFTARIRQLQSFDPDTFSTMDEWSSVTDERGIFAFDVRPPGIYQVQIRAEGYAPAWSRPVRTDGLDSATIVLTTGGTIIGHIRDERDNPISGAKIIPLSIAAGSGRQSRDKFVSEDGAVESMAGEFTLPHVMPGTETLRITHTSYAPAIIKDIAVLEGRTTADVDVTLTAGGTIEGYVYDGSGKPQSSQQLHPQDKADNSDEKKAGRLASTVSNANGFYRFEHVPEQLCYVVREDYESQRTVVHRAVVPKSNAVTRLDLGGQLIVTGIIAVDGRPLAGSRLTLCARGEIYLRPFHAYATTDEHGAFTFRGVAPGVYTIDCTRPTIDIYSQFISTPTIAIGSEDLDLGTVTISSSQLNVSVHVADANALHDLSRVFLKHAMGERAGSPVAGDKGRWTIDHIEAGDYLLVVARDDGVQWSKAVNLEAGKDPWYVSWDLPNATATVSGHIIGPLPDDLMFWREDKAISGRVPLVGLDSFSIANLPAGNYLVGSTISYTGGGPGIAKFSLLDGEKKEVNLDSSVRRDGNMAYLNIIVVDENGVPRTDAISRLDGASKSFTPVQSVDIGDVFLVPPGRYTLSVQLPGHRTTRREMDLKACELLDPKPQNVIIHVEK